MVARFWRGWTTSVNADAYEYYLERAVFPKLRAIEGHYGVQLLRRDLAEESEFVVINFFDSMEAVKRFAGENSAEPVFEPEAKLLLSRIETEALHYEVRGIGP